MKKITQYILSIALLFIIMSIGCEKSAQNIHVEDCNDYDYLDCNTYKPTEAYLYMKFTINEENNKIPYEVYKGKLEQGNIIFSGTATNELDSIIDLKFEVNYTVKATYKKNGTTIYAIDMDKGKRWSQNVCDSTCWHYIDPEVDLRLH